MDELEIHYPEKTPFKILRNATDNWKEKPSYPSEQVEKERGEMLLG